MSFPNPDNYAKGCECSATSSSVIPDDLWRSIPAPLVHTGLDTVSVSYAPSNTKTSWLTENTEVWLFVYKRRKKNNGENYPTRKGGFRHPIDTSKPVTNSNFWGGGNAYSAHGYTYRTEFPFVINSQIPDPYKRVVLDGFDPYQFFKYEASSLRQLLRSDCPVSGSRDDNSNPNSNDPIEFHKGEYPVFAYGSTLGRQLRVVKFQFRFVIPNPDSSSTKYTKIMGPPSEIVNCRPIYYNQRASQTPQILGLRLNV